MTAELLAEHIAKKLRELEQYLTMHGEPAHSAAVERARTISDHVLADFLRRESAPAHIRDRVASIWSWLKYGEVERAYREHETLQLRLDAISRIVRTPLIVSGEKQRRYLAEKRHAANDKRAAAGAERHAAWQAAANGVWDRQPKLSKTAVAKIIAAGFPDANAHTIRRAIRKLAEPG
jgi:hypothetical protein